MNDHRRSVSILRTRSLAAAAALAALACGCSGSDPTPTSSTGGGAVASPPAAPRLGRVPRIDPAALASDAPFVPIAQNRPGRAGPEYDRGQLADDFGLEHLQLILGRSGEEETALAATIDALHDKTSPSYHRWLGAKDLGEQWGVSDTDLRTLVRWLESFGMRVTGISPTKMQIDFQATAGQVARAFRTPMHTLDVDGARHYSNLADPQIPAAFRGIVVGIYGLHDFRPHPMHVPAAERLRAALTQDPAGDGSHVRPDFDVSSYGEYLVGPQDFATIYNVSPLWTEGNRGSGQTIAVIEDTDVKNATDVSTFRTAFGLSGYAGTFTTIHPNGCTDPGVTGDEGEAALDVEWAGAVAPDATIELASCSSVYLALYYLVNHSPPPIISVSYGACESETTPSAWSSVYQTAAAAGVSVFVSSGDQGSAVCDGNASYATHGLAVNGLASSQYNVAVGGTDFMDDYDHGKSGLAMTKYWSASNSSTYGSALSYIPEIPWNSSCASQLIYSSKGYSQAYGTTGFCSTSTASSLGYLTTGAGSGGVSTSISQPTWQTGVYGLPSKSGGKRYLPDVSLFAANGAWAHAYVFCMSDTNEGGTSCTYTNALDTLYNSAGGTSFAAPAFAGIQALINKQSGASQGNPNYTLYKLAAIEHGLRGSSKCNSSGGTTASPTAPSSTCIFNDVTQGDIDVPCTGTTNCYGYSTSGTTTYYGAISTSTSSFSTAYAAATGWDYATGLGSVNVYNLVHGF
ncbi:MAG TPA: S53 family peptidase [Polyangiaceae bacterium]